MPDVPKLSDSGENQEEKRIRNQIEKEIQDNEDRLEAYQSILDQAFEFLGSIMTNEQIRNMPYKVLLYESERRRLFLESTRNTSQNAEIEKQLKNLNSKKK